MDPDSGMASFDESKDATPEKPKSIVAENEVADDDDEDFEDETIGERIMALSEMFPESVRKVSSAFVRTTASGIFGVLNLSRAAIWIVGSSSLILFGPLIFEVERAQLEESHRREQKQFLLGPNAMSGNLGPNVAISR